MQNFFNKYYADEEIGLNTDKKHHYYKYCHKCSKYFLNNIFDNHNTCLHCRSIKEKILTYIFKFFP